MSGKKQKSRINHPEAAHKEIEIVFLKSTDFANREEIDAREAALEREHPGTNVVQLIEVDGTGCAIWKESPD